MTTKLTLTVEKKTIEKAKLYALHTERSLSEIVETYLDSLVSEDKLPTQASSKLKILNGSIKLPKNFNEKTALLDYFNSKHK